MAWPPTEEAIRGRLSEEGLKPVRRSNRPGERYAAHSHSYEKVIYVVSGSIVFELPEFGRREALGAGDCLVLAADAVHSAIVGDEGVVCLEAHR